MATDVGENTDPVVVAAHNEERLAEKLGGEIVAGPRHLVGAADIVPFLRQDHPHLEIEIVRRGVEIAGQALCRGFRKARDPGEFPVHFRNEAHCPAYSAASANCRSKPEVCSATYCM